MLYRAPRTIRISRDPNPSLPRRCNNNNPPPPPNHNNSPPLSRPNLTRRKLHNRRNRCLIRRSILCRDMEQSRFNRHPHNNSPILSSTRCITINSNITRSSPLLSSITLCSHNTPPHRCTDTPLLRPPIHTVDTRHKYPLPRNALMQDNNSPRL